MKKDKYKIYNWDQGKRDWVYGGRIEIAQGKKLENTLVQMYQKINPPNWDRIISWLALVVAIAALFT